MKQLLAFLLLCCALSAAQPNSARMLSGVNAQTGTTYTFVPLDATRLTTFSNASPVSVTLPSGLSRGFGIGTEFSTQNLGNSVVTITCSGCVIYSSSPSGAATLTLNPGSGADLYGAKINYSAVLGGGGGGVTVVTASTPLQSSGGITPNISIPQASGSVDGYLLSTDWNTFSAKIASIGVTPPIGSTGSINPTISMTQSGASSNGWLSATDWNAFNSMLNGPINNATEVDLQIAGVTEQKLTSSKNEFITDTQFDSSLSIPALSNGCADFVSGVLGSTASACLAYPSASGTQVVTSNAGTAWGSSMALQGTDTKVLSSGTVSGAGNALCTDANLGATTAGCTTGTGNVSTGDTAVAGHVASWANTTQVNGATTPVTADLITYHTPAAGLARTASGSQGVVGTEISGDCTTSGSNAITCTKTSTVAFGTFATQNYAAPPAIGGTTPNTGKFSTINGLTQTALSTGFSVAGGTTSKTLTVDTTVSTSGLTLNAVVPNTFPASGQLLVGNVGGTAYAPVGIGTDATLSSAGALTVTGLRGHALPSPSTGYLNYTGLAWALTNPFDTATFTSGLTLSTGSLTLSALSGTQCLHEVSGVISGSGADCGAGGGGSGAVNNGTGGRIGYYASTGTTIDASGASVDSSGNISGIGQLSSGSGSNACGTASGFCIGAGAGALGTAAGNATDGALALDSVTGRWKVATVNNALVDSLMNESVATAATVILPTATRAGDIVYWDGSIWNHLAGNTTSTKMLQETSAGVPSWIAGGAGSVTSIATTGPISGGTITTTGTISCPTCAVGPGASTTTDLASYNGAGGLTLQDSGIASGNVVTAASNATAANYVAVAAGANKAVSWNQYLPAVTMPAFTGDVTSTNGTVALTMNQFKGAAIPTSAPLLGTNASQQLVSAITPTLGAQNTTAGSLTAAGSAATPGKLILAIAGATGYTTTLTAGANSGSITITLPTSPGALAPLASPAFTTPDIGAATGTSLLATGIIDGKVPITVTTGATATLGAATYKSGYTFNQEATAGTGVTYTLPATATGLQYCVRNSIVSGTGAADTGVLTVYPPASSYVILNGTRNTIGGGGTHGVASGGAAGDSACFIAVDATDWEVFVIRGTWTAN